MELGSIIVLGCIISGFFIGCFEYEIAEGFLTAILGAFVGLALSIAVCGLIVPCIGDITNAEKQVEVVSVQELSALKDNDGIYGNFFLGSGKVESTQYLYYISYEDGKGYMTNKINANYAYIDYLNREGCEYDKPVKVQYKEDYKSKVLKWCSWCPSDWTTFYVPEGSVLENYYSIDLE